MTALPSLADPDGSGALVAAVSWVQGTLLGTVATIVAVIAVASIGFLMLSGRVSFRHGATVVAGCFILFGAAGIAAGLQAGWGGEAVEVPAYAAPPAPAVPAPRPSATPSGYDPYAGASVPG